MGKRTALGDWLAKNKKTQADLVRATGIHRSLISRYVLEERFPGRAYARIIEQATGVPSSYWDELEARRHRKTRVA